MLYRNLYRAFDYTLNAAVYLASLAMFFGGLNSVIVQGASVFAFLITGLGLAIALLSASRLLFEFGDGILIIGPQTQ